MTVSIARCCHGLRNGIPASSGRTRAAAVNVRGKTLTARTTTSGEDHKKRWVRTRPEYPHKLINSQLLLLSGPPGLGKTTLAHIVAQHAGYNVFEINASDARSADVVDDRIRPAIESGAKIGSSKPNLVVIDEIDGATGGSDNVRSFTHLTGNVLVFTNSHSLEVSSTS